MIRFAHEASEARLRIRAGGGPISGFERVRPPLGGEKRSKLWALVTNAAHDDEHYGNIVTYLRMNGMVPPSSRGQ